MDDRMQHNETICRTNLMLEYRQMLNTVCKYLGLTGSDGLPAPDYMIYGELEKRLMPEGYEWPRYEDGELVKVGDEYECWCGKTHVVKKVTIMEGRSMLHTNQGHTFIVSNSDFTAHGKCAKRPDAIAADNKPLKVGHTVYAMHYGYVKCTVLAVEWNIDGYLVEVENENGHKFRQTPDAFTHKRPALDAQGTLTKVGDTVWHIVRINGVPSSSMRVIEISNTNGVNWVLAEDHNGNKTNAPAEQFTHIKPEPLDSWKRIETDCSKTDIEYCDEYGLLDPSCNADEGEAAERHCIDCGCTCGEKMARDLVRRCKALAERGE